MENSCIFLGMFVVSLVSGNPTEQVFSCPGGSVLLSCSCEKRDTSKYFSWQMDNYMTIVSVFRQEDQDLTENFKGRVESFYEDDPNNCSILLKNVTYKHHGTYTCYYWTETFNNPSVILDVYGATNATPPASCSSAVNSPLSSTANKEMHWLMAIPVVIGLLLLSLFLYWKVQGRANKRQRAQIHRSVP
ncbi:hypothetical protein OJAV_G00209030 [Oryzias javanicus]|uniref:Ig-like domain-containing protein n=1 Tax=Oryzias javanicus TaxID=123683 RepID=A0A3S2MFN5_ORYJA|nr:hypothetical protein OJAV_G00209030 [Oryzias javanicus]